MAAEIHVAGFTLTAEEWERFELDVRAELAGAAASPGEGDDDGTPDTGADVLW